MGIVRKHVRFTGRVQGVNFRYTSSNYANKFGLTGWVRNDYDGSVEMEVQGTPELINRLFETMKNVSSYIVIDNIEQKTIPTISDETGFNIRY